MIGLLLRPDEEPEVVERPCWASADIREVLMHPGGVVIRPIAAPGEQGGRMQVIYPNAGPGAVNHYATALLRDQLPKQLSIRGIALVLRTGNEQLSTQDCLALAARLVASETPVHGRGGPLPRRGRNRAGKPAPTRGEPC